MSCGASLPRSVEPAQIVSDAPIAKMHLQRLNRTPGYLASLVSLCRREMRTTLRETAVEVVCAEQIEMMTTGRRVAGVLVIMEVILVTRGIWVTAEIVEIMAIMVKGGAEV